MPTLNPSADAAAKAASPRWVSGMGMRFNFQEDTMTTIPQEDLDKALDKAVLGLFQDPPLTNRNTKPNPSTFITTIYSGLEKKWDDKVPTACTNGKYLRINPDWFMSLSIPMRCTLLAHECWHVAFFHCDPDRMGERHPRRWNVACDHAINLMLEKFGFQFDDANPGLRDPRFIDMSAEQIYDILEQEDPPGLNLQLPFGEDFEVLPMEPDKYAADKHDLVTLVLRASQMSKLTPREHGSVPGSIEEMLDRLLNPKLPWHKLLAKYLNDLGDFGFNWRKPSRRYLPQDIYLPSPGGQEGLQHILWGIDCSGSMSTENLRTINSEVKGAKERLKPKSMTVASFDCVVHDIWEFEADTLLDRLTFTGRGGTNIQPLFDLAKEMRHRPNLIVVLSDLECTIPDDPKIPVLWIRFGKSGKKPDYGRVIDVDR